MRTGTTKVDAGTPGPPEYVDANGLKTIPGVVGTFSFLFGFLLLVFTVEDQKT